MRCVLVKFVNRKCGDRRDTQLLSESMKKIAYWLYGGDLKFTKLAPSHTCCQVLVLVVSYDLHVPGYLYRSCTWYLEPDMTYPETVLPVQYYSRISRQYEEDFGTS
jgi:hypothetical protein